MLLSENPDLHTIEAVLSPLRCHVFPQMLPQAGNSSQDLGTVIETMIENKQGYSEYRV
jgi:hypothetical protein